MPDEVELVSISFRFDISKPIAGVGWSMLENHGFVRIRHRCLGEGATDENILFILCLVGVY